MGAVVFLEALPANLQASIPQRERRGAATQFIVDGKPFLVLAGELYNNSASSLEYMKAVWPRLTALHLNTVLAAVSWALLEPVEGKFDYSLVDGLIREARARDLHLVLLGSEAGKTPGPAMRPIG
jgi:beta-galactosidase GanA